MKIQAYTTTEVFDKHGQLKYFDKREANSLVRSFLDLLATQFQQATIVNGTVDTGGTTRSTGVNGVNFSVNGLSADATLGIVLGTGTGAVSVDDYRLNPQIAHGNAATQLFHNATTFTNPATVGSTRSFTVVRTFTNNSGGTISPAERGIYAQAGGSGWKFCIDRTLASFSVLNTQTVRITYTLSLTV